MSAYRVIARLLVALPFIVVATVFLVTSEPVRGIDLGASRLVKSETFPEAAADSCTWEAATRVETAFQRDGAAAAPVQSIGDPRVAARTPTRTIRDPYPGCRRCTNAHAHPRPPAPPVREQGETDELRT